MSSLVALLPALIEGAFLGALFFIGLWFTVSRGLRSRSPAILFVASLLMRTFGAVAGFWLIAQGDPSRLAISLLGFVLSRALVMRFLNAPVGGHDGATQGGAS